MVLVRRSELYSLKRGIDRALNDPVGSAAPWAFTWLGVAVAAVLSLLTLVAVKGQHLRTWVIEAHAATIIAAGFLAAYMGYVARQQGQAAQGGKTALKREIDELDARAPSTLKDQA